MMTKKKATGPEQKRQLNLFITQRTIDLLQKILERDGTRFSAQVERAVKLYAASKGIRSKDVTHDTNDDDGAAGR